MPILDFPTAPVYGQVYKQWTWDGGRWTCGLLPGPPPTITAIDPTEVATGSAAFMLTVVGTNYLADSVINYGGQDQPTTFVDATILVAQSVTPPAVDGTKMVYVRNGTNVSASVPIEFTTQVTARMISATPDRAVIGGPNVNITVDGENFTEARYAVRVDGTQLSTAMASSTQLMAAVPSSATAKTSIITVVDTTTSTEIPGSDTLEFYDEAAGGVPDWVPADALIHVDFLNGGRAWDGTNVLDVNGIGTLLGNDPAVDALGKTSRYDPANIEATGYRPLNYDVLAIIGAAKAVAFPASSMVVRWSSHSLESPIEIQVWNTAGLSIRIWNVADWEAWSTTGSFNLHDGVATLTEGAMNASGLTINGQTMSMSTNGTPQVSGTISEADLPAADPISIASIAGGAIVSVTIYPPMPDLALLTTP